MCSLIFVPALGTSLYRTVNCKALKALTLNMCKSKTVSITQVVFSTLNTITDCYLLAIPTIMLRTLQISKKRRLALLIPFMAGSIACALSVVRLAIVIQTFGESDVLWNAANVSVYRCVFQKIV